MVQVLTTITEPSLAEATKAAVRAEAAGFDGVFTGEMAHDPFLPLAPMLLATNRIGIGAFTVAFARSPMTVAHQVWDLHAASGGRMSVALGSQIRPHIERRFSMPFSRPAARMREFICAMRAIFTAWQDSSPLRFAGDFYTHTLMTPNFNPGPLPFDLPHISLAAVGPEMTRVAAEVADGVMLHPFMTERYARTIAVPALESTLGACGRRRAEFAICYAPFLVSGRDEQELAASATVARQRISFYGSTPAYRRVLELHGWGDLQSDLYRLSKDGRWADMPNLVDDEVLQAFAIVAPHDEIADKLAERVRGIADRTQILEGVGVDQGVMANMLVRLRAAPSD